MLATSDRPMPKGIWLLLLLLLAGLLYLPGVNGPWLHDDYGRITLNPAVTVEHLDAATLARSAASYPERPLAMMSYAAAHALCGPSPACQKVPNVLLHLLTAVALYAFLAALLRIGRARAGITAPDWLPLAVTALWLLHPLHVSSTLYAVQRMTIVATLCVLVALYAWLKAREAATHRGRRLGWLAVAVLATFTGLAFKESALLVPAFIVLLELLLLTPAQRARIRRPVLLAAGLVAAFALLMAALAAWPPGFIANSYTGREFTPPERLLTETRILVYYLSEIVFPLQERMSLHLDVFDLSTSLTNPLSTLGSTALCLALLFAGAAALLRGPSLAGFGILFFFAGHLLESGLYGLILAYEHRNYLPSPGILLALCACIAALPKPRISAPVLLVCAGLLCAWNLKERAVAWGTEETYVALLDQPRWEKSAASHIDIARYASKQATLHAADPMLARLLTKRVDEHFLLAAQHSRQNFLPLANLVARPSAADARDREWDMLEESAAHAALDNTAINAIGWLTTCTLSPACPVDRVRLARVIDLMLANPRQARKTRTQISRYGGFFLVKVYGDPERGLALSRAAAASGQADARESLIKNLAFLGRTEEATAEYARLAADQPLAADQRARIEAAIANPGVVRPGLAF